MVGQTVSHYRILEELGGGGMGVVYKAEDLKLGRPVALKFLSEELSRDSDVVKRFQREARAASSLNHPNICTIHDIDAHEGRQFIVMELMEGQTLKHSLEGGPMATEELVALGAQICEGLAAAHERGIIHRDIKPANLFVTESGLVKVLDFGVAKLLPREDDATLTGTQTAGGAALGTLAYMAPEQLNREAVDARTDIYALGCVLYEMATGERPFAKEFGAQRVTSILSRRPEAPSKLNPAVPARLDEIVLKCLEKEPAKRYQSAKELQGDLRKVTQPATEAEHPAVPQGGTGLSSLRKWWLLAAGVAVVIVVGVLLGLDAGGWRTRLFGGTGPPQIDSIAVLPLKNLMGDPEQDYFVEGMHEALTAELSKISALKVISRTSTMLYKDAKKPLPQVARELGVAGLIEGSVLREGDQVRITVQLIHGPSDRHLWAQHFDRQLQGILALHSDVAQAVAEQVKANLTPAEHRVLVAARPVNPAAYEFYLKGRYYWQKRTDEGLRTALEFFQQALDADPTFAAAYAGKADAYLNMGGEYRVLAPAEARPRAKAAALRALELDPDLAEAHASLGLWYYHQLQWAAADKEFQRALELTPNYATAHHWYAMLLSSRRRFDEALSHIRRARELDPLFPAIRGVEGSILFHAGRYEESLEVFNNVIGSHPSFPSIYAGRGLLFIETKRFSEGLADLERAVSLSDRHPGPLGRLGYGYGRAGRSAQAIEVARELEALSRQRYVSPYDRALVYLGLGDRETALPWLEQAFAMRDASVSIQNASPVLDGLRSEPRFQALLRRMNFPEK